MEALRKEYRGHVIELREAESPATLAQGAERAAVPQLVIDGQTMKWGQLPDGSYFLEDYAYDWRENLMDLAVRFIDYQTRSGERRQRQREKM
jgi:hypothetical protein